MRVVIGGAYNGKRQFVKEKFSKYPTKNIYFLEGKLPIEALFSKDDVIVIGNFEQIILQQIHLEEEVIAENIYNELISLDHQAEVICICTDIGRGIVPLQKEDRKLRDTCGRLYQKLFAKSDNVIRVWYGIPQIIKGEEWL